MATIGLSLVTVRVREEVADGRSHASRLFEAIRQTSPPWSQPLADAEQARQSARGVKAERGYKLPE